MIDKIQLTKLIKRIFDHGQQQQLINKGKE